MSHTTLSAADLPRKDTEISVTLNQFERHAKQPWQTSGTHTPQKLNTLDLASEILKSPLCRNPVFSDPSYGTCWYVQVKNLGLLIPEKPQREFPDEKSESPFPAN